MFGKIDGNVLNFELCDIIGDLKNEPLTVKDNWLPIINLQPTPVKDVWEMTPNFDNFDYLMRCDAKINEHSETPYFKLIVPEIGWVWNVEGGGNGNWFGLVEGWESERGDFYWDEIFKMVVKHHYSLYMEPVLTEWTSVVS